MNILANSRLVRRFVRPIDDPLVKPRLPYPDGWFALGFSYELPRAGILRRRLMGEDVVVYRTNSGLLSLNPPIDFVLVARLYEEF
jgi:hypothetical protein